MPRPPVANRRVLHADGSAHQDQVVVEEPLEIRVAGETVSMTMRTPGEDAALALGFLLAEGVIRHLDDVSSVGHCGRPDEEGYGNTVEVSPAPGAHVVLQRLDRVKRGTLTTSACGICGRQTIDDLVAACGVVPGGPLLDRELIERATRLLREGQPTFERTGGAHAAAILDERGAVLAMAEDIGRHNAVDKAVGALLRKKVLPVAQRGAGTPALLVVSGRASFEIVQKACVARLAAVVSVSAASSMAIELAERTGLTLVGFARGSGFNVYAGAERLRS